MCEDNALFWIQMSVELTVRIYALSAVVVNIMRTVKCVQSVNLRYCINSGT